MKPDFTNTRHSAPRHRKEVTDIEKFGTQRTDLYAWMKPKNWQAVLRDPLTLSSEIKEALELENSYTQKVMSSSASLMNDIKKQLNHIEQLSASDTGYIGADYFYFETTSDSGDAVFSRRNLNTGCEDVLLDMACERKKNPNVKLSWVGPKHSPDHALYGWAIDETGAGDFTINVKEIAKDRLLVCNLHDCHGSFAFDKYGHSLFWVGKDHKGRPNSVWRRDIKSGADVRCFENNDTSFFIELSTSASGDYVFIQLINGDQTEVWFIPSDTPATAPKVIETKSELHSYQVEHWQDRFVIRTNADGADDFKIVTAPLCAPSRENWDLLVPHRNSQYISGIHAFSEYLVRTEWRDAKLHLVITGLDGDEHDVSFDDEAYAVQITPQQDYHSNFISYSYSTPATPSRLIKTMLCSRETLPLIASGESPDFSSENYLLQRIEITATDGASIPVTLLSKACSPPHPEQPLYLFAYGAYGEITEAEFRPEAIALVERGWTFAIAHVRGGGERGASWWRPTVKQGKRITFSDFIDCAQGLIALGHTSQGNIVAHGMSAGGLLMGSVFSTHPHLWAGVIAQVPFVDVLNTLDDWQNHPLGTTPFAIWGDPRIEDDYRYIASYSPYDVLKPAEFPALLTTGGVADERVAFWEPLKFVAKARDLHTGHTPLLSLTAMQSGHGGDPSPEGQIEQSALFLSFAIRAAEQSWASESTL